MTSLRRVALLACTTAAVLVTWAGPASAHIEPDVTAIPAGEPATVTFTVEHGCAGEATTKIEIKIPEPISDAQPDDVDGWEGSAGDQVVTFEGGPQPPDAMIGFPVTFTAPDTDSAELVFPIIQTCGPAQLDWIDPDPAGEHPAPIVTIGPAGSPTSTVPAEHDEHEDHSTVSTSAPTVTASEQAEEDKQGSTAPIILGGVALILVVGTAVIVIRTRGQDA